MPHSTRPGYVYLLINYSMPNQAKIGKTTRSPTDRVQELSASTGVPTPFCLVFDILVPDVDRAERMVHDTLAKRGHRTAENREFFGTPLNEIVKLMIWVRDALESTSVAPALSMSAAEILQLSAPGGVLEDRDNLFEAALRLCVQNGQGSISFLQRMLMINHERAARLIDQLQAAGVLGPSDGTEPCVVLLGLGDEV